MTVVEIKLLLTCDLYPSPEKINQLDLNPKILMDRVWVQKIMDPTALLTEDAGASPICGICDTTESTLYV
jgi:hypothetical protein